MAGPLSASFAPIGSRSMAIGTDPCQSRQQMESLMRRASTFRVLLALAALLPAASSWAQSAGLPSVGTPATNRFFGGASGSPRPVEQTPGFGNNAASVYSTGRPLISGATTRAESGGLSGTIGETTTGGLFQTSGAPTGGLRGLAGSAPTGGSSDFGTSSGTGGIAYQSARSGIANSNTGGLGDAVGSSLTGGR